MEPFIKCNVLLYGVGNESVLAASTLSAACLFNSSQTMHVNKTFMLPKLQIFSYCQRPYTVVAKGSHKTSAQANKKTNAYNSA